MIKTTQPRPLRSAVDLVDTNGAAIRLGYNAVQDKGRRQPPRSKIVSEDKELTKVKRKKLIATAKDQPRNNSILAWMLRRHLDYVSRFDLHIRTGNPDLDKRVYFLFKRAARRENFDIAGRHDRYAFMRIFEACKTIDGDAAALKLDSGHLQGVESDLITTPSNLDQVPKEFKEKISDLGLVLNAAMRTEYFCVCSRDPDNSNNRIFQQMVAAADVIFDGYFTRFSQSRGITLFAPALNMAADLSETLEWVALKAKLHALFGLAFMRQAPEQMRWNKTGYDGSTDNETTDKNPYEVNINPRGIFTLDLDPGDKVEPVESKTPSGELLGFSREEIRMVLLALDIPFTAYDSMKSSFSARIADRSEYEESAEEKRRKNAAVLREYSDWRLDDWSESDDKLPDLMAAAKIDADELKEKVEWIPTGTPWLDKRNEIAGDKDAISLGVDSAVRVARRRGIDAYQIIDEQAEFLAYAKSKGVPIYVAAPGQVATEETQPNAPDEPADDGE